MRRPLRTQEVLNPDRVLSNLLIDYVEGRLGGQKTFRRASVIQIDHVGGQLAGPGTDNPTEPPNPKGSIKARVLTDSLNIHTPDEDLPIFWPMLPYDLMPLKETEHVYVFFEDLELEHGLWVTRIAEPNEVNNINITPGTKKFINDNKNELSTPDGETERLVQNLDQDPGVAEVSEEFSINEDIPEFLSRVGDRVINGSNNTAIVLSRDRIDTVDSGEEEDSGAIDLVAGRAGGDINYGDDVSRVLITMKSDVDTNFSIDPGEPAGSVPHVAIKSDEIRLIGRGGIKIVSESGPASVVIDSNGKITIENAAELEVRSGGDVSISSDGDASVQANKIVLEAENVEVGSPGASHPIVHGDSLKDWLKTVLGDILASATVDVAGVPALGLITPTIKTAVEAQVASFDSAVLSSKNTSD